MESSKPTPKLFEDLILNILEKNNFKALDESLKENSEFDLLAEFGNERWAIEIKYYRSARVQPSLIENAASRLLKSGLNANVQKGMLIVSCIIQAGLREVLEEKFQITFVDQVDLRNWCNLYPELEEKLDALLEFNPSELHALHPKRDDPTKSSKPLKALSEHSYDTRGTELCMKLTGIKKGRGFWQDYETLCEEILKYLFPNDLLGWHSQRGTDDGLNRFDYVCRVRPTTEFWQFVINHLDSRYVLFEFKNYEGKIKQGQILTTEKYLLERGLRRMAIIMTRVGADDNAIAMAKGAMREHGKLILVVNDDMVCTMLQNRERGEDPTDYLFEIADNFMLTLSR
jgi:hypothetical protein